MTIWQKMSWIFVALTLAFGAYAMLSSRGHAPVVRGEKSIWGNDVEAAERKLRDIERSIAEEDQRRKAAERAARESFEQSVEEVKRLSEEFEQEGGK